MVEEIILPCKDIVHINHWTTENRNFPYAAQSETCAGLGIYGFGANRSSAENKVVGLLMKDCSQCPFMEDGL